MAFRPGYFFTIIAVAAVLVAALSIQRFFIRHDYFVSYDAPCDPSRYSCFVACADEACTEASYYLEVRRHAADLQKLCGPLITDCPAAARCVPSVDRNCTVSYCDAAVPNNPCDVLPDRWQDAAPHNVHDTVYEYGPL